MKSRGSEEAYAQEYNGLIDKNVPRGPLCQCGHQHSQHAKPIFKNGKQVGGGDCLATEGNGFDFCKCSGFRETNQTMEAIMAKKAAKKSATPRKKGEGRTPALAPFVSSAFTIVNPDGKEARVSASGVITYKDKEYSSPSTVGTLIAGNEVNGWIYWRFKKDGELVTLNTLRGKSSPLKAATVTTGRAKAAKKVAVKPKAAKKAAPKAKRALKASAQAPAPAPNEPAGSSGTTTEDAPAF